jgi:hypothetical protein
MATTLKKRISAIEAARKGIDKRQPEIVTQLEGDRLMLVSLRFPAGVNGWRPATADEFAEVRSHIDTIAARLEVDY